MKMRIAITGGIGSGKSFFCKLLERRGIKVYDCDKAAKLLLANDKALQEELAKAVGESCFADGILQKRVLAQFILSSQANKQLIDSIVHPAVARDFLHSDYQWLESAILFESGFIHRIDFDFVIGIASPLNVRIERIMKRDGISREKAQQWIDCQWPQDKVMALCNAVIENDGRHNLEYEADKLLRHIALTTKE